METYKYQSGSPRELSEAVRAGRGGAAEGVSFHACAETNDTGLALTMGSLFDGIGGFPLAAKRCGIEPVWASEIEWFPMLVTKLRFPRMEQLGDIAKLNGATLPPVDIICGGSPCQDCLWPERAPAWTAPVPAFSWSRFGS